MRFLVLAAANQSVNWHTGNVFDAGQIGRGGSDE